MRLRIYNALVNRVPGIYDRYHTMHDNSSGIIKIGSWIYLLLLNFAYYILQFKWLDSTEETRIYQQKKLLTKIPESELMKHTTFEDMFGLLSPYNIISFDIFDTLVFRPFSDPTDLFYIVGQKLGYMDFKRIRVECEKLARRAKLISDGGCEVNIAEIWEVVEQKTECGCGCKGQKIKVAAQNCYFETQGAFTGEVSVEMAKDAGCELIIIGHSERRQYFSETDEMINKKAKAILAGGLLPIICCGETLEQREAGVTDSHIASQIRKALDGLSTEDVAKSVIAYEPIWAIGTGKSCDADEANRVIKMIRSVVSEVAGSSAADSIRILYGGSVKPSTIEEQMSKSDIDGALVGGASLKADEFAKIVNFGICS